MKFNGIEEMYADTFISYLDRKFNIRLLSFDDSGNEFELFYGNKWDALRYLKDADYLYVLCDTDAMYVYGVECSLYIEAK